MTIASPRFRCSRYELYSMMELEYIQMLYAGSSFHYYATQKLLIVFQKSRDIIDLERDHIKDALRR